MDSFRKICEDIRSNPPFFTRESKESDWFTISCVCGRMVAGETKEGSRSLLTVAPEYYHIESCPYRRAVELLNEPDEITPASLEALGFVEEPAGEYVMSLPNKMGYDFYNLRLYFSDLIHVKTEIYQANRGVFGNTVGLPISSMRQLIAQLKLLGVHDDQ